MNEENETAQQDGATAGEGAEFLRAQSVDKSYMMGRRRVDVLRSVDLELAPGEFVALRGASGAGKSTLLHLLGGLDTPDRGRILFNSQDLTAFTDQELARFRNLKVGFIFQAYHLLPELDALENVCLPARMARRDAGRTEAWGRELLGRVGLRERMDHRPSELSGGERQRVAIARALINRPELVLADEPTGNLDSQTGGEIIDLLCSLQREHQTALLIATHDSSVAGRAPRIVTLVDGRIDS